MTTAIRVESLRKRFHVGFRRRRVMAVHDASFEVPSGCVFGLVGPNGAGKTTTIKILVGLLKPTGGFAEIDGHTVPSVASRRGLGYLPETPQFYDHLRPLELLVYVGQLYGMARRPARRRADALIETVGLADAVKKPIRKFSKGMTQRLGIAQALMPEPRIVILDEPQSGLDPIGRKEVKSLIVDLKKKGCTVFFSSHVLSDVEDVCDEIGVLINGRMRDIGRVDRLLSPRILETEIEAAAISDELRRELSATAQRVADLEGSTVFVFEGECDAAEIVSRIVSDKGRVLKLLPHRERLEDLFVREAGAQPNDAT